MWKTYLVEVLPDDLPIMSPPQVTARLPAGWLPEDRSGECICMVTVDGQSFWLVAVRLGSDGGQHNEARPSD